MKQNMVSKDTEGALQFFASDVVSDYRNFFNQAGKDYSTQIVGEIYQITSAYVNSSTVQYRFEKNIDSNAVSFSISFVRESGRWKITEF